MKTFDEIYEELQNINNNELNVAWNEAKKESKNRDSLNGYTYFKFPYLNSKLPFQFQKLWLLEVLNKHLLMKSSK